MAQAAPAITYTLQKEGGFSKNPNDSGNWYNGELLGTNWGISAPVARESGYMGRMEDMTQAQAIAIYQNKYWKFDGVNDQAVATKIFDGYVNMGGNAIKILQRTLNTLVDPPVAVDGGYGPDTEDAVNAADPASLLSALAAGYGDYYRALAASKPQDQGFLKGWLKRAEDLPGQIVEEVEAHPGFSAGGFLLLLGIGLGSWLFFGQH